MKRILLLAGAIPLVPALGGCWDGWRNIFDPTPSREHRLEDLRVLAVITEPASVAIPASFAVEGSSGTITLDVEPRIFDPRGGEIDVAVRLCAKRASSFVPCVPSVTGLPGHQARVRADADDPLGPVPITVELTLDAGDVRALYAEAGAAFPSFELLGLDVIVDVSRDFNGTRERESAVLSLPMMLDPTDTALPDDTRAELIEAINVIDCSDIPNDGCFPIPDEPVEPACGNGVVEPGEDCEPPNTEVCDPSCFAIDFCAVTPLAVCLVPPTNERPLINGLQQLTAPLLFDPAAPPDVENGGVIRVKPGEPTFIAPAALLGPAEPFLSSFESGCPADSPQGVISLSCGAGETLTWRVYVLDEKAELVHPADDRGVYFGNSSGNGFEGVGVTFQNDTAAGTREPIIMVLTDGRGGMDLQVFTLEAD